MLRFDPSELRKYGGLTLIARNVVEGFLTGVHRGLFKGSSVEFAEHRAYTPGDEIRRIDWRAYGKTDRYFVKEYEEETNLKVYLLVDMSGSMAYRGAAARSKFEHAQQVAASLAYLLLHQADSVGLITYGTKVNQLIPPRATPKHLLSILRTLETSRPLGETTMAPILEKLAGHYLKRRGMVIILSDFFDELGSLVRALQHLRYRNHEVVLFHVLAREEIEFPFRKLTQFRSLEATAQKLLDARRMREEYLANFRAFRDDLQKKTGDLQIDYHLLRTDEPVDRALGIYLHRRMSR